MKNVWLDRHKHMRKYTFLNENRNKHMGKHENTFKIHKKNSKNDSWAAPLGEPNRCHLNGTYLAFI